MSSALVWVPTALVVAALMDVWAALLHGLVWHGPLMPLHKSHHEPRLGRFEKNDALSFLHAPIAIALVLYGCRAAPGFWREVAFGTGIGMTLFGFGYTLVHDGLVHKRLPVRFLARSSYLRVVARAHRVHHTDALGGVPFGLFSGPLEMRLREWLASRSSSPTSARPTGPGLARRDATPPDDGRTSAARTG